MNENNKNLNNIPDTQLETIVGGSIAVDSVNINNYTVPEPIKSNRSTYSSNKDNPKYRVGQRLYIKYLYQEKHHMVPCIVRGVSESPDLGMIYEEFGYTVEILATSLPIITGNTVRDVYESCLYEH